MAPKSRPLIERFWEKVSIRGDDECWLWIGRTIVGGNGQIWSEGRKLRSNRVAWELTYGSISKGMNVCHHCDNPLCCNPRHLFLGTQADNQADMVRKGRSYHPIGERNNSRKLSDRQVFEIRSLVAKGITQQKLADRYGVSQTTISEIVSRQTWVHI